MIIAILIYVSGYFMAYFLSAKAMKRVLPISKSDRKFLLWYSLGSWFAILGPLMSLSQRD